MGGHHGDLGIGLLGLENIEKIRELESPPREEQKNKKLYSRLWYPNLSQNVFIISLYGFRLVN
jgi:hypothetical protein